MNTAEEMLEASVVGKVKDHVIGLIANGGLKRGTMLPSYRVIAREMDAACATVKVAMDELALQGVVRRQRARGCYVNRELSRQGRRLKTLAVIHMASQSNLFGTAYLQQILQGINSSDTPLNIHFYTRREPGFISAARLGEHEVDGALLLGVEDDAFFRDFAGWGIPGVVVDQIVAGNLLDCVACDNEAGTGRAVRHLVELGHRHIRYLGQSPTHQVAVGGDPPTWLDVSESDYVERSDGVVRAAEACPGVRLETELFDWDCVGHMIREWRAMTDRPTAFLTDNEDAGVLLTRAAAEQGVSVPGHMSVCTVAGVTGVSPSAEAVTGTRFDFVEMGRKAVTNSRGSVALSAPNGMIAVGSLDAGRFKTLSLLADPAKRVHISGVLTNFNLSESPKRIILPSGSAVGSDIYYRAASNTATPLTGTYDIFVAETDTGWDLRESVQQGSILIVN